MSKVSIFPEKPLPNSEVETGDTNPSEYGIHNPSAGTPSNIHVYNKTTTSMFFSKRSVSKICSQFLFKETLKVQTIDVSIIRLLLSFALLRK